MNSKLRPAAGVTLGLFAALAMAGPAAAADPAAGCVRQDSGYAAPGLVCPPVSPPRSDVLGAEPNVPVVRSDVLGAEPNVTVVRSDVLSATGSNVEPVLLLAGGLVVVGAGVLGGIAVARRRHTA
ncbi:hypothetical protein BH11ACT1_BH11ACT1_25830 [soil metagenome]